MAGQVVLMDAGIQHLSWQFPLGPIDHSGSSFERIATPPLVCPDPPTNLELAIERALPLQDADDAAEA